MKIAVVTLANAGKEVDGILSQSRAFVLHFQMGNTTLCLRIIFILIIFFISKKKEPDNFVL